MNVLDGKKENLVLGIDIGTRNVVGTVGYRTDEGKFIVVAQTVKEHVTRAMLDGQIHDIGRVAQVVSWVKEELEVQINQPLTEVCIAAAGRVLKTVTCRAEYNYPEETVVTGEDIHTLDLIGVEKAQDLLNEKNDTNYKFYCVGYSVVKSYLNDDLFTSLEGHKANKIAEDIIVTFLPEDVVDGLYSAVGQAGLSVANLTLEPIAAINVAIPENFRMLNIALVDVGAGTSDICITKEGSITAYGMIPHAGDELTEEIVQQYLVDFQMAEHIKLSSTIDDEVTYEDIMSIKHSIPSEEVWELTDKVVDRITSEVAEKIIELNGGQTVSATFVVGGGGKVHNFTKKLAEYLNLPEERVALRGEEVLKEVTFLQEDIKKDPLLVTPIGICLNYYDKKNNFIMIRFNGERMKLYDNNRLTIVDAALQAGFSNDKLFPRSGKALNFTVNGNKRIVRGEVGEPAVITLNGKPANINTPLEPNCNVEIIPSTQGERARYTISELEEYTSSIMTFIVNGRLINCPKFLEVNGVLEPSSYAIQDGDIIENRGFYTVEQVAEFMDVDIDLDEDIYVNNRLADMNSLVYENFSIEWTVKECHIENASYYASDEQIKERKYQESLRGASIGLGNYEQSSENDFDEEVEEKVEKKVELESKEISEVNEEAEAKEAEAKEAKETEAKETEAKETEAKETSDDELEYSDTPIEVEDELSETELYFDVEYQDCDTLEETFDEEYEKMDEYNSIFEKNDSRKNDIDLEISYDLKKNLDEVRDSSYNVNHGENEESEEEKEIIVTVNNSPVTLTDKNSYVFVDIFDKINFDLSNSQGRGIITTINGRDARFTEEIHTGDKIEVYWKEM
ncbi:cell division FtsA domain-containing protein [Lachnobacterium bovis]|uniref:cell division FtsA domain-containing protein n=1 Tax=Lachnobacterium bovis TaxID=140626 RepID=UPI0004868FD3